MALAIERSLGSRNAAKKRRRTSHNRGGIGWVRHQSDAFSLLKKGQRGLHAVMTQLVACKRLKDVRAAKCR